MADTAPCDHTYTASLEELKTVMAAAPAFAYLDSLEALMPGGLTLTFNGIEEGAKCPLCAMRGGCQWAVDALNPSVLNLFNQEDELKNRADEFRAELEETDIDIGFILKTPRNKKN